jgi:chromosome segregation ATPase
MCLAFTGGIIYLLITIENEKMELQKQMKKLALSKQGLASAMAYLEESNETLEKKVKNSEGRIRKITSEYEAEKAKNTKVAEEVEKKEGEIRRKEADIEKHEKENRMMARRLKLMNSAFSEIKLEYDEIAEAKKKQEEEIDDLDALIKDLSRTDSTQLGTVVIR